MSFTEDGKKMSDSYDTDVGDSDNEINTPGNIRNGPWFTVIEPNSFVIDRLPPFSPDHVEETNRYATSTLHASDPTPQARGNNWKPVSKQEISTFFGLMLAMGIVRKPSYASYWANGNGNVLTYTPNFSQIMSRNRFQQILRFLHCNDNGLAAERGQAGYNPLHKVANIIEFFNRTFEENYRLSQNVCIDERMIGFKGRHFLKQYIANKKAHRWGVKAWVLAESGNGYTHQLEIYKGKSNSPRHPDGQGYKVVMDLMRPHFGNQHHVTIDSWFTSPKLVHDLRNRGTYCTGTVITTRKGMPQRFRKARVPKGEILAKSQGPVMSVLYSDRRQVSLLTTAGSANKGKVVNAPALVHKYNETMGGVDLGDQFIAQYEPQFRSLKLWKKILFNLLMTATVNAYICYKNTFVIQKKMDHLTFQQEIVQDLIGQHREGQTRPGRSCLHQSTRLTARHFIEWIPYKRRMRCAVCSGKENRFSGTRIRTWCPDCGVGLCVGRCFKHFHTLQINEE
ncbi:unnamed protein product [Mytilus coruscus]|uniref:PiggyBac transposable element-derived protein domain-containing protein n=1 Tax=Mytilus coruscus TaxID=42192 RepID=A0A6J8EHF3_MYTCO|nr:unnamed protein product [Mytilus coruscus]